MTTAPRDQEAILLQSLVDRFDRDIPGMSRDVADMRAEIGIMKRDLHEVAGMKPRVESLEKRMDKADFAGRVAWITITAVGALVLVVISALLPELIK